MKQQKKWHTNGAKIIHSTAYAGVCFSMRLHNCFSIVATHTPHPKAMNDIIKWRNRKMNRPIKDHLTDRICQGDRRAVYAVSPVFYRVLASFVPSVYRHVLIFIWLCYPYPLYPKATNGTIERLAYRPIKDHLTDRICRGDRRAVYAVSPVFYRVLASFVPIFGLHFFTGCVICCNCPHFNGIVPVSLASSPFY